MSEDELLADIRRCCIRLRVPATEVPDLAQTIFAEMLTRFPDYDRKDVAELHDWLLIVARNKAADRIRRERRRPTRPLRAGEAEQKPASTAESPSARLETKTDQEAVNAILARFRANVSDENFRILQMFFFGTETVAEIAAALGLTPHQVSQRKKRMLQRLRELAPEYLVQNYENE